MQFKAAETVRTLATRYQNGISTSNNSGFLHIEEGYLDSDTPMEIQEKYTNSIDSFREIARDNHNDIASEESDGYIHIESGYVDLVDAPEEVMRDIRGGEMSMIFQDPMTSLNPAVTIGEQIAESLELHQYGGKRKDTW
ncbi:MAG: peptide ABC transporter ATP-binding protein, partial [Halobacteriaceae archaeon]